MWTRILFCLATCCALMGSNPVLAGINFSELREVINDPGTKLDLRLEALEEFSTELNRSTSEELVELADGFLKLELDDGQFALVCSLKAQGLINLRKTTQARNLIDSVLSFDSNRFFDERGLYLLYFQRGRSQWRITTQKNRWTKALSDFQTALDLAEKMEDITKQVSAHDALGYVYMQLKDPTNALDHYSFIIRTSEDEQKLAQARFNIALSHDDSPLMQDTALRYMLEARDLFLSQNRKNKAATASLGIAKVHRFAGRLEKAKEEYYLALELTGKNSIKASSLQQLGLVSYDQGDYDQAKMLLDSARKWDRADNFKRSISITTDIGKTLVKLGQSKRGLSLCDSVLAAVLENEDYTEIQRTDYLYGCYDCIQEAQFDLGMYTASWKARDLRDSSRAVGTQLIENRDAAQKMELFEYQYLREQEKRKVMDKQKDDQNRLLLLFVLLLIAFAIFITSRYRFTRKQSALISTQRQQLQDRQRELIRANAELEIALNHKAVFLSNMSHEIRTPLNAIVGMSNLATKEDMAEGARKYLRNIVTASSNLIDIVNDILDFSKLEAGKLEIAQEPFSVADALEVAENVMRIPAEQKGLEFKVESHPELPSHLLGDASRLNQVLINLVGNAIKFTLEGGVTMKAEVAPLPALPSWCPPPEKPHKDWFVVRVKDTGIGIPEDKLEKIFESFNQGDQLKTRKFGGTGLGLSISKQIVELQGGVIWVESVEGEGSTFAFALPAMISEAAQEEEAEEIEMGEIGPMRILIAEDNPFNVIVTEDTLNSELDDLTIGKAENGRVAFEKVRDEEWDLVLMDIHMPEMSGLEATAAIRKLPGVKSSTIIIAMTASVLREETDSYMRHGMDGFVPKPFQVDQLTSEIRRLRKEQKSQSAKPKALPPLRILIAEDNPFNVIVAEDTLRSELPDVTIGKAENGKLAFEAVRDGDWDLVLMDIAMPEMTGLEATSAIRKLSDPVKANTTIIAMTASVLKEETDHYLKQGMNGFVPKPFKVEQLIGEIHKAHIERT